MKPLGLSTCIAALSIAVVTSGGAEAETVRIAILQHFPPLIEQNSGLPKGPLVEKLLAASERAGLTITFVPTTLELWQDQLADGRADAFFPMAVTPTFRQTYDFSESVMSSGGGLFVRAPDQTPSGLAALGGKTLVTPKTGPLADYIAKTAPNVKLVVTKDYEESFAKLLSGEADVAALNLQVGVKMVAQQFSGRITPAAGYFWELPLALVVLKRTSGPPPFLRKFDHEIIALRAAERTK